jgi:hypothetical protein
MSAEDHVAALKELMGPDTVVVSKIGDFIERLLLTVALYREGIKKVTCQWSGAARCRDSRQSSPLSNKSSAASG